MLSVRALAALLVFPAISLAQAPGRPSADEAARGIQRHYDQVKDFTADFTHTYQGGVLKKTISERGTVQIKKPGRKLVIWIGPGWPMLNRPSDGYTERQQRRNFDAIVELSTALREARITVYSVSQMGASGANPILYQRFLNPVRTYRDAEMGNLGLKVLVTQTGGRIMGPDNDVVSQINRCTEDANAFYRISFDPPAAEHAGEYHDIRVTVDRPDTAVRTTTGYYDEQLN